MGILLKKHKKNKAEFEFKAEITEKKWRVVEKFCKIKKMWLCPPAVSLLFWKNNIQSCMLSLKLKKSILKYK